MPRLRRLPRPADRAGRRRSWRWRCVGLRRLRRLHLPQHQRLEPLPHPPRRRALARPTTRRRCCATRPCRSRRSPRVKLDVAALSRTRPRWSTQRRLRDREPHRRAARARCTSASRRDLKVLRACRRGRAAEDRPIDALQLPHLRLRHADAARREAHAWPSSTVREQRGFKNSGDLRPASSTTAPSSTTATSPPVLGMDRNGLLQDRAKRRKYGLPPELRMPKLGDAGAPTSFSLIRHDSDWVNSDITRHHRRRPDPDRAGLPGRPTRSRTAGAPPRFVTEAPILHFFSIQSARYAVKTRDLQGRGRSASTTTRSTPGTSTG